MPWLGLTSLCFEERQAVLNFFPAPRCGGFVDVVGWKAFRTKAVDMLN